MKSESNYHQKLSTKCSVCKVKSLFLTSCQCGKHTCLNCRYPDKHGCDYDFKKEGAKELEKNNPIVVGEKVSKI
jgi:hypothetical protein